MTINEPGCTSPRVAQESFNKMYGIVHPRGTVGVAASHASKSGVRPRVRPRRLLLETMGWERPYWYESNAGLLKKYEGRLMPRNAEWESRWWSPIINANIWRCATRRGITDLSAFV